MTDQDIIDAVLAVLALIYAGVALAGMLPSGEAVHVGDYVWPLIVAIHCVGAVIGRRRA